MKNTYLAIGAVAAVVLLALLVLGTGAGRPERTLTPVASFSHSHGIATDAGDPTKVYIATHEGLYLLKDDTELYRIGTTRDDLMGFSVHPTDPRVFFSSGHPAQGGNIGLQKTTDGGVTWERVSEGLNGPTDFHAMAVSTADPSVIYGFHGGKLQRSIDGGGTWEYAKGAVAPFSLSTHPTRTEAVYAATQDGVLVSADMGDSWQSISEELEGGAVSVFALSPSDPMLALAFSEKLGGLGKSTDGGVTWKRVSEIFGNKTILYLAFSQTVPEVVYALSEANALYKSTNAGDTWERLR